MNSTNANALLGVYIRLAGVDGGRIVTLALIPPAEFVDKHEFLKHVIVPEVVRLVAGVTIRHGGDCWCIVACVVHRI